MLRTLQLARAAAEAAKKSTHDVANLSRSFRQLHLSARDTSIARRQIAVPIRRALPTSFRTFAARTAAGRPNRSTATAKPRSTAKKTAKPTKRAAAKKKVAPKRKPARKALTEKQKEAKEAKKKREHLKELKTIALFAEEPKGKPATAWSVFMTENSKGSAAGENAKQASVAYKGLAPHELEVCPLQLLSNLTHN
jgi:hypothetical protein